MQVVYTKIHYELPAQQWNDLIQILPADMQERNARYVRWQDRHAHLFARLLLLEGGRSHGLTPDCLTRFQYTPHARPFIDGGLDFNFSHSVLLFNIRQ